MVFHTGKLIKLHGSIQNSSLPSLCVEFNSLVLSLKGNFSKNGTSKSMVIMTSMYILLLINCMQQFVL